MFGVQGSGFRIQELRGYGAYGGPTVATQCTFTKAAMRNVGELASQDVRTQSLNYVKFLLGFGSFCTTRVSQG